MTATAPDYAQIVRVVQLYVDAWNTRDASKFREAFAEDAWIFFTDRDGVLHKQLLDTDVFREWVSTPLPAKRSVEGRVISVVQAGDIANVLLGFDDDEDVADDRTSWVDFHTLLRINGVWKITNKTATHATRAAWAADRNVRRNEAAVA
jgi:hypothetical protein